MLINKKYIVAIDAQVERILHPKFQVNISNDHVRLLEEDRSLPSFYGTISDFKEIECYHLLHGAIYYAPYVRFILIDNKEVKVYFGSPHLARQAYDKYLKCYAESDTIILPEKYRAEII